MKISNNQFEDSTEQPIAKTKKLKKPKTPRDQSIKKEHRFKLPKIFENQFILIGSAALLGALILLITFGIKTALTNNQPTNSIDSRTQTSQVSSSAVSGSSQASSSSAK